MEYKDTIFLPKSSFEMRANLPIKEPKILEEWDKEKIFYKLREKSKGREKFVLHDGPPYANGHIHMGTALNKILKDKTITHCYKKKRGMYYSWENCGYVSYKQNAGVYNKEEAVNYCKGQLDVTCIPIITKEHNDFLFKQIERIKKGVIK